MGAYEFVMLCYSIVRDYANRVIKQPFDECNYKLVRLDWYRNGNAQIDYYPYIFIITEDEHGAFVRVYSDKESYQVT